MPFDKFGIPFLYASKTTAGITGTGTPFFYQQSSNIRDDTSRIENIEEISNSSNNQFTINFSGATSIAIMKDSGFSSSIGGCDMNFEDTADRGYANKASDPRDVEIKILARFTNNSGGNRLSLSGPTGDHTSSNCCQGYNYMTHWDPGTTPVRMAFRKEVYHVHYVYDPKTGSGFTHPSANFKLIGHGWVGLAYVRYNKKDGVSIGKDSVVLENWICPNPDSDKTNWIMVGRTEDKGGWGTGGDICNGDDDQIGTWSNAWWRLKATDIGEVEFKFLTMREIDPTLSFDDDPTTPPTEPPPPTGGGGTGGGTTTIQGSFKFQNDVNTLRGQSACAGTTPEGGGGGGGGGSGGSGGLTRFYSQPPNNQREMGDSDLWQHRTRITERVLSSSSGMHGKIIKQVDIPLQREGTPSSTPTVNVKIYSLGGSVIYDSPTHIDPSTLTTEFVYKTFDFSTNTHTMVTGDRLGVHYEGTSESNYVIVGYIGTDELTQTLYEQYELGVWEPKSRELAMDVYEGT